METCECTPFNPCTIKCRQWKTQEETIEADREKDTDNIPREETPNPETPTKPEGATTPPDTPVKAVDAVSTTISPEAMKMAETTGSQEETITREQTNNTIKDAGMPWHCIMCRFSKATEIKTNNATETMARKKKTIKTAQITARTDNLTNTPNNEKSDTNTKEGKKSKR